jgi:UDP-N-acetylmuramoylalanine--D-glutamate ligase
MSALDGMQAIVIGAGRSGRSAACCLAQQGATVRVIDRSESVLRAASWPTGIEVRVGDDRCEEIDAADLVVPSPGVPRDHGLLREALARGIPVWSEIELAARFLDCPVLAVTGTNGKSTTTVLLGAMLKAAGGSVFVGGNLGTPLCDAVTGGSCYEAAVVEVSSFQLEWVERFQARVAVLLNLTPDHQDRYRDLEDYGEAKARLLDGQTRDDFAVLNRDDAWVWSQRRRARGSVFSFGRDAVEFGTYVDGDDIVVWGAGRPRRYALGESPLTGEHNRENIQAAVSAAAVWGVPDEGIHAALRQTGPLPHRLGLVRELAGVRYFDDSKGTNTGAVQKSIESFAEGIILLLGGRDKGGDFAALRPAVTERVAHVICFGEAGPSIAGQLNGATRCSVVPDLARAVETAAAAAKAGQTVVLSPGCASFDEFRDYAERGQRFRALVEAL